MKELIEQAIAVSITKKSRLVQEDDIVRARQQSGSSSARHAPIPANRRTGTISLARNKLN